MNLIINDNKFSINNVILKKSKRSTKIIYNFKTVKIIGITFTLKSFECNYNGNFSFITLKDKKQLDNLKEIDKFLKENITNYETFIKKGIIKIKGNIKKNNENHIDININSLKNINDNNRVQIFII
jgi:hypothetical protein